VVGNCRGFFEKRGLPEGFPELGVSGGTSGGGGGGKGLPIG